MKAFIVIDMQNDFLTGALSSPDANNLVQPICNYLHQHYVRGDAIVCTRDTHNQTYLNTMEGKLLPIKHCIAYTPGWDIAKPIIQTLTEYLTSNKTIFIDKPTFGTVQWTKELAGLSHIAEFILMGTRTDICVVSNAIILKTLYPNTPITVVGDLCSGTTPEAHEAALEVMKSCQIKVVNDDSV